MFENFSALVRRLFGKNRVNPADFDLSVISVDSQMPQHGHGVVHTLEADAKKAPTNPQEDDPYFAQKTVIIPFKDQSDGMTFYQANYKFTQERAQVRALIREGKPPGYMPNSLSCDLGRWIKMAYVPGQEERISDLAIWHDQFHIEAERLIVMAASEGKSAALKAMSKNPSNYAYATKRVAMILASLWMGDQAQEAHVPPGDTVPMTWADSKPITEAKPSRLR